MTVALGLVCKDGVIVASDSMSSSDLGTATVGRKVSAFENNPAVWTMSGSVYVREEVASVLRDKLDDQARALFTEPQVNLLRGGIKKHVHPVVGRCYKDALAATPFAEGSIPSTLASSFLFGGFATGQAWLLEFDQQGSLNWHTENGFYAVGSGGQMATVCYALMKHYIENAEISLAQGELLAYRAIETTCSVAVGYVGLPVQMAVADASGARVLSEDEINKIGDGVASWKQVERESLLIGDETQQEPAALPSASPDESPAEAGNSTPEGPS